MDIDGQLSNGERQMLTDTILQSAKKPRVVLEVGTWLGGGSTLHILRALHKNGIGHLWGIEGDHTIYERMIQNLRAAAPETLERFTPLFGCSQDVIPKLLAEKGPDFQIDIAFLDGGNNPLEQITEFELIKDRIPVDGVLMSHDARVRKGKWLVPYVSRLDNWKCELHDLSEVGLFYARKLAPEPSPESARRARSHLRRLRLQPVEIAAALLPKQLCGLILQLLPRRLAASLAEGAH
jgi:predicted O-methyltransferase YrrM